MEGSTIVAIVAIIGSFGTVLLGQRLTHRREIRARQFGHKREAYTALLDFFFSGMNLAEIERGMTLDELERAFRFMRDLLIWGSPETLKLWLAIQTREPSALIEEGIGIDDLLRSMRSDLGHDDSELAEGELFRLLMLGHPDGPPS